MTPDHWHEMEALYHAALELTGEARSELLRRANPKVRSAVEAMLAQDASAVLDRPAWEQAGASIEARPFELAAGVKLGPYEVVSVIGSGGMGKVYRAKDARLNREVAIKASAAQFSQRFEREAKTIAALNHPNICQIYDAGRIIWSWNWWMAGPSFPLTNRTRWRRTRQCGSPCRLPPR